MNKLVRKFVSLILAVESFSLLELSVKGKLDYSRLDTYVEINRQNQKDGHPIPLYRNENDELVDIFGTVLRYRGVVLKVTEKYFSEFPLWDESKSPIKNFRTNEEILKSLSRKPGHGLGRTEKNELVSIRYGEKICSSNFGCVISVPERYYINFPLVDIEMPEDLYKYLVSIEAIANQDVYRNENNRLVDEFGNGLKLDGKFIRVPNKYLSEILEHPWVEGVRKGEVFLDSWDDFGTKIFKVVDKNKNLINSDLSISCKYSDKAKAGDWGCGTEFWYNTRPNCIYIPLLDNSEENVTKFNESLKYELRNSSYISREIEYFERKCKGRNTSDNQENSQLYVKSYDKQSTTAKDDQGSSIVRKLVGLPFILLLHEYISQLN